MQQLLDEIIETVDLSNNLDKQRRALYPITGWFALFFATVYVIVGIALLYLAWRFDFQPTLVFAEIAVARASDSDMAGWVGAVAAFSLTALPTLAELGFLPILARADVRIARWGMAGLLAFDLLTDAPEAWRFISQGFGPLFTEYFGPVAPGTIYIGFVIWVLLSTLVFEFLFIVSVVGAIQLIGNFYLRSERDMKGGGNREQQQRRSGATAS